MAREAAIGHSAEAQTHALQVFRDESRPGAMSLAGDLDVVTYPSLAHALDRAEVCASPPNLELDFRDVRFIDLGAIRWLCSCQERLREQGGGLAIRDASPWVRKVVGLVDRGDLLTPE